MDFVKNIRKLPINAVSDEERRIKRSKSTSSPVGDCTTGESSDPDDAKKQIKAALAEEREQIMGRIDNLENNLLQIHQASQRLSKLSGSQSGYDSGNQILENARIHIAIVMETLYKNFDLEDISSAYYPICKFYTNVRDRLKFTESALYPLFHGLNRSVFPKNRVSRPHQITALNSIHYPITEIDYFICQEFVSKYANADSDKLYGMRESDKILDASISKLCKSLKALFMHEFDTGESMMEMERIVDFYLLCQMLEVNTGKHQCLTPLFQKSYVHTLKAVKRVCYTEENIDRIFEDLRYFKMIDEMLAKHFAPTFKGASIVIVDNAEFKPIFSTDTEYLSKVISTRLLKFYNDIENMNLAAKINRAMEFYKIYEFEMTDWELGASKFTDALFQSLEPANEDKLKEMVKLITTLTEMARKVDTVTSTVQDLVKIRTQETEPSEELDKLLTIQFGFIKEIFQEKLKTFWSKFKRDFAGHYAFYLDYRLKLIPKSKDRIKLESELTKLQSELKIMIGFMNTNSRIKFRRMYATQFVQRMLGSLYQSDFTQYTNISDCEAEMCTTLDLTCQKYKFGEPIMDVHIQIRDSFKRFEDFKRFQAIHNLNNTGIDVIDMIGLPEKLNNAPKPPSASSSSSFSSSADRRKNDRMILPTEMNQLMKEFRSYYKTELKRQRRSSAEKLSLQLNYTYSRMTIDYTLSNGMVCHLNCNMYQGMILTLFNDLELEEEGLTENDIATKLNISAEIVQKSLNALGGAKFPILVSSGNKKWCINENFELPEKLINSGSVINIPEKRKAN